MTEGTFIFTFHLDLYWVFFTLTCQLQQINTASRQGKATLFIQHFLYTSTHRSWQENPPPQKNTEQTAFLFLHPEDVIIYWLICSNPMSSFWVLGIVLTLLWVEVYNTVLLFARGYFRTGSERIYQFLCVSPGRRWTENSDGCVLSTLHVRTEIPQQREDIKVKV